MASNRLHTDKRCGEVWLMVWVNVDGVMLEHEQYTLFLIII